MSNGRSECFKIQRLEITGLLKKELNPLCTIITFFSSGIFYFILPVVVPRNQIFCDMRTRNCIKCLLEMLGEVYGIFQALPCFLRMPEHHDRFWGDAIRFGTFHGFKNDVFVVMPLLHAAPDSLISTIHSDTNGVKSRITERLHHLWSIPNGIPQHCGCCKPSHVVAESRIFALEYIYNGGEFFQRFDILEHIEIREVHAQLMNIEFQSAFGKVREILFDNSWIAIGFITLLFRSAEHAIKDATLTKVEGNLTLWIQVFAHILIGNSLICGNQRCVFIIFHVLKIGTYHVCNKGIVRTMDGFCSEELYELIP